jgi:hypothetical protein
LLSLGSHSGRTPDSLLQLKRSSLQRYTYKLANNFFMTLCRGAPDLCERGHARRELALQTIATQVDATAEEATKITLMLEM